MANTNTQREALDLAHEVAELKASYRRLPEQLKAVDAFKQLFDQFARRLRPLIQAVDGEPWNPADRRIASEVGPVDDLRLDLYSRQSTALPSYRDPLGQILRSGLRLPNSELYEVFGPLEPHGVVQHRVVSLNRFDAQVAEAKADIIQHHREVQEQMEREGSRLHELQDAMSSLVLTSIRNLLWKTGSRRVVTSVTAILLAWIVPPVRVAIIALWTWMRALLHF